MRTKKVIGYVIAGTGLLILVWNAFVYLGQKEMTTVSTVVGLMLCVIGAGLVSKATKEQRAAGT